MSTAPRRIYVRDATLEVAVRVLSRVPSALAVHRFLREVCLLAADQVLAIQYDTVKRAVFVTCVTNEVCDEVLRRTGGEADFEMDTGVAGASAPAVMQCSPPCGPEAACRRFSNGSSHCVCPHDSSPPTAGGKCPLRRTVPLTPRPILHIIPPTRSNGSLPNAAAAAAVQPVWMMTVGGVLLVVVLAAAVGTALALWRRRQPARPASPAARCCCCCCCCWCLARGAKARRSSCSPSPLSLSKGLLEAERYTPNPQYSALSPGIEPLPVPLLPRNRLRLLHELGEGCFGKVFKGEMLSGEGGTVTGAVAVKVLKESASSEAEQDFLREVETMSAFHHPNILSLVGVVAREGDVRPWMVFEFMAHGDLAEVLRSNSRALWRPVPGLAPLTPAALLSAARQVAAGMRYLAEQRFVHRDLACRNCLVGEGLTVKIADFGMSRDVYTCDYYKVLGSRPLPVRWMSPESIIFGRFTLESDVWSFGVVLWEIYSLGRQPYFGHSNEEVMKLVTDGIMLSCPEGCPPPVRDLMGACWKTEPRDRLRFPDIHDRLVKAEAASAAAAAAATAAAASATGDEGGEATTAGSLPRPPGDVPVAQLRARAAELLDGENYLLPQQPTPTPPPPPSGPDRREYFQPLPD